METTLIPNHHYILLKDDFSDLEEKLNWCNNNYEKCIEIIKNANAFMTQFSNTEFEEQLEKDVINKYFEIINVKIVYPNKINNWHDYSINLLNYEYNTDYELYYSNVCEPDFSHDYEIEYNTDYELDYNTYCEIYYTNDCEYDFNDDPDII